MKQIKYFRFFSITCLLLLAVSYCATAQKTSKSDLKKMAFKNMVDSQRFIFEAQSVTPLRGHFRNLTSSYNVRVTEDTLQSYLPYFGRAYSPPVDPTQSDLEFTSTDFSYTVSPFKKNGWQIVIKPKDKSGIQQYLFTIFDNGNATLRVISTSRDAISFNGYVRKSA
jgi:Domain of unknown function (DUF4251)